MFGLASLDMALVHSELIRLTNRAIDRTIVFNLGSALLVIATRMGHGGPAEYWLCGAAILIQFVTPNLISVSQRRVESAP